MEKFIIFDRSEFYGKHILKENIDVFFNDFNILDNNTCFSSYKVLYFIYDYGDVFKSVVLKQKLRKELIFVIMDEGLIKRFKRQNKIKFYTYIQIFNILKDR